MKIALYPGSFNPLHAGHVDIIHKALGIFDKVILAKGINPEKFKGEIPSEPYTKLRLEDFTSSGPETGLPALKPHLDFFQFTTTLPRFVDNLWRAGIRAKAVVRGLRNGYDLQHEMVQQYWYEDLGLLIPVVMIVTDRRLAHISSSALRALETFKTE